MNGNRYEVEFQMGSASKRCWLESEEDAMIVVEALKLHESVCAVRLVGLIHRWSRDGGTELARPERFAFNTDVPPRQHAEYHHEGENIHHWQTPAEG